MSVALCPQIETISPVNVGRVREAQRRRARSGSVEQPILATDPNVRRRATPDGGEQSRVASPERSTEIHPSGARILARSRSRPCPNHRPRRRAASGSSEGSCGRSRRPSTLVRGPRRRRCPHPGRVRRRVLAGASRRPGFPGEDGRRLGVGARDGEREEGEHEARQLEEAGFHSQHLPRHQTRDRRSGA